MTKRATPRLTSLLDRVERICNNKAELARFLGVSYSHIKKWITERAYEPGGEATLHMLEWVQAEEANKTKSPGSVDSTARAKTQLSKFCYEKTKPGPKKR